MAGLRAGWPYTFCCGCVPPPPRAKLVDTTKKWLIPENRWLRPKATVVDTRKRVVDTRKSVVDTKNAVVDTRGKG